MSYLIIKWICAFTSEFMRLQIESESNLYEWVIKQTWLFIALIMIWQNFIYFNVMKSLVLLLK